MDCTCQAPPSMGLSRYEYWSGLPFPSPGDIPNPGIEPRSPALQADSLLSELQGKLLGIFPTRGLNPGLSYYRQILYQLSHKGSPRILEWVAYPFSADPGIEPGSPELQVDSLLAELPEKPRTTILSHKKPRNTGVGSLSLLHGIFPTQESNRGLLHCRWILYQLSYQGSWNGLQFPPPWDLPTQGSNLCLLHCGQILYYRATRNPPPPSTPRTSV